MTEDPTPRNEVHRLGTHETRTRTERHKGNVEKVLIDLLDRAGASVAHLSRFRALARNQSLLLHRPITEHNIDQARPKLKKTLVLQWEANKSRVAVQI